MLRTCTWTEDTAPVLSSILSCLRIWENKLKKLKKHIQKKVKNSKTPNHPLFIAKVNKVLGGRIIQRIKMSLHRNCLRHHVSHKANISVAIKLILYKGKKESLHSEVKVDTNIQSPGSRNSEPNICYRILLAEFLLKDKTAEKPQEYIHLLEVLQAHLHLL